MHKVFRLDIYLRNHFTLTYFLDSFVLHHLLIVWTCPSQPTAVIWDRPRKSNRRIPMTTMNTVENSTDPPMSKKTCARWDNDNVWKLFWIPKNSVMNSKRSSPMPWNMVLIQHRWWRCSRSLNSCYRIRLAGQRFHRCRVLVAQWSFLSTTSVESIRKVTRRANVYFVANWPHSIDWSIYSDGHKGSTIMSRYATERRWTSASSSRANGCLHCLISVDGYTSHPISSNDSPFFQARVNQEQEHFLINPFGLMYHEVTGSSLVKVDIAGKQQTCVIGWIEHFSS